MSEHVYVGEGRGEGLLLWQVAVPPPHPQSMAANLHFLLTSIVSPQYSGDLIFGTDPGPAWPHPTASQTSLCHSILLFSIVLYESCWQPALILCLSHVVQAC